MRASLCLHQIGFFVDRVFGDFCFQFCVVRRNVFDKQWWVFAADWLGISSQLSLQRFSHCLCIKLIFYGFCLPDSFCFQFCCDVLLNLFDKVITFCSWQSLHFVSPKLASFQSMSRIRLILRSVGYPCDFCFQFRGFWKNRFDNQWFCFSWLCVNSVSFVSSAWFNVPVSNWFSCIAFFSYFLLLDSFWCSKESLWQAMMTFCSCLCSSFHCSL